MRNIDDLYNLVEDVAKDVEKFWDLKQVDLNLLTRIESTWHADDHNCNDCCKFILRDKRTREDLLTMIVDLEMEKEKEKEAIKEFVSRGVFRYILDVL